MVGTNAEWVSGGIARAVPEPVASVCLRVARAHSEWDDDGDPVLILSDGETTVELTRGLSADPMSAAQGAQRLAQALMEFARSIDT